MPTIMTIEDREAAILEHAIAIEESQIPVLETLAAALGVAGAKTLLTALENARPKLRENRQQQVANASVSLAYLPQFIDEELERLKAAKEARAASAAQ